MFRASNPNFGLEYLNMLRRFITPLISVLIIVAVVYGYFQFSAKNTPVSSVLAAVPEKAFVVIETDNFLAFWEKFAQTSVIWEELKQHQSILKIHQIGSHIDSIIRVNDEFEKVFKSKNALLAVIPTGATFQGLFALNLPAEWSESDLNLKIKTFTGEASFTEVKKFNESSIYTCSVKNHKIFWSQIKGVFLISSSQLLVEDAVLSLNENKNVLNNASFKKINETKGLNAVGNFYINYTQLGNFIKQNTNKQFNSFAINQLQLGSWSGMDISLKSNKIILNGFIETPTSKDYLGLFVNQEPQEMTMLQILPVNTAFLQYYGLSDFANYKTAYKQWQRDIGEFAKYEQLNDSLNRVIEGDIEENCLSWISGEMAVLTTEKKKEEKEWNNYLVFKTSNPENALSKLTSLSNQLGFEPVSVSAGRIEGLEMALGNCYAALLGQPFDGFNQALVFLVDDYIVIASSSNAMRAYVTLYESDRTLGKNANFISFIENVGSRSNLLIYSSIARSTEIYKQHLKQNHSEALDEHLESIRKFEGFVYQIVNTPGELLYNNILLSHNPIYEEEQFTAALWRCDLEADAIGAPQLVTNHYTKAKEIVIQDINNTFYLISNTGKVLWKKKLDGPILGKVHQIDVYKNDKLQLLFNTANTVYLFDRNGNNVERFPIKLSSPATTSLGLFDYDNDKEYRIAVASENKKMALYNAKGEKVDGWNVPGFSSSVNNQPQHLRVGKKDYIFVCESNGKIHLLDRQGKPRHKVKAVANNLSGNPLYIEIGKDIKSSYLLYSDTLGNLVNLGFDNEVQTTKTFDGGEHCFVLANTNDDQRKEVVIGLNDQIIICDQSGKTLLNYPVIRQNNLVSFHTLKDKTSAIGFTNDMENLIYLMDSQGNIFQDFPLNGTGAFEIEDINKDGTLNLVVLFEKNVLAVYNLDN